MTGVQTCALPISKTAVFKDTISSISYDTEDENQIALIDYTYNGVYVGNASVDISTEAISSYDFDSSMDDKSQEEEDKIDENIIFVNIKKLLLFVLIGAGILILLFIMKSLVQNYSFSRRNRRKLFERRRRKKWLKRKGPNFKR